MSAQIVCMSLSCNEGANDEKSEERSDVEGQTQENSPVNDADRPMFFIQLSSVQMISGSWACPCQGTSLSIYESDKTSAAGCNLWAKRRRRTHEEANCRKTRSGARPRWPIRHRTRVWSFRSLLRAGALWLPTQDRRLRPSGMGARLCVDATAISELGGDVPRQRYVLG